MEPPPPSPIEHEGKKLETKIFSADFIEERIRSLLGSREAQKEGIEEIVKPPKAVGNGEEIKLTTTISVKTGLPWPLATANVEIEATLQNERGALVIKNPVFLAKAEIVASKVSSKLLPYLEKISETLKSYIESEDEKKRKVEKMEIENGKLKVTFSTPVAKIEEPAPVVAPISETAEIKEPSLDEWTLEDEKKLKRVKAILEDMKRDTFKYFLIDKMNTEKFKTLFGKDMDDVSLEDINSTMERYMKTEEKFIKEQRALLEEEVKLKEKVKAVEKALVDLDALLLKKVNLPPGSERLSSIIVKQIKNIPGEITMKERKEILDEIITMSIPEIVKICDASPQPADFEDLLKNLFDASGLEDTSPERDSQFKEKEHEELWKAPGARGSIIKILERGYKYQGKVISKPKVTVGRG